MPSAAEWRRHDKAIEQRDYIRAATEQLRRDAAQGSFPAGMRGEYTTYAVCAVLDEVAQHIRELPAPMVSHALTAAKRILVGPDGHRDTRAQQRAPLSAGDGY